MRPDGLHKKQLTEIVRLPTSESGTGKVKYDFSGASLSVEYEYFNDRKGLDEFAAITFVFAVVISIEYETNNNIGLPDESEVLYGFEADVREDFRGFQLWLSGNELITVVCNKVLYGDLEY